MTAGHFGVQQIYTAGLDERSALAIAAALENPSEHPLAKAVVKAAASQKLEPPVVADFKTVTGRGVEGTVNRQTYQLGLPEWAQEQNIQLPQTLQLGLDQAEAQGESVIMLIEADRVIAVISMADQVRQ